MQSDCGLLKRHSLFIHCIYNVPKHYCSISTVYNNLYTTIIGQKDNFMFIVFESRNRNILKLHLIIKGLG